MHWEDKLNCPWVSAEEASAHSVKCGVCVPNCECVSASSFVCLRAYVENSGREKVWDRRGGGEGGRGQSSLKSCLSTCVFIVTFHFSSNSAPFPSQVHVCQRLLLSFVQPRCAWSNHYLSSLYIYYFILNSSGFFLFFVSVFVFYLRSTSCSLPFIDTNQSPQLSCAFCKGLSLDITVCWCNSRISASHRHPQKFLKSLCFIKKKIKHTHTGKKKDICMTVLIFCCFITAWEGGRKKTTCMTRQCFQSCCIYPLWIHCDCTVLYLTITGIYMVLRVCRWQLTHIKYTQSPINSPTL